MIPQKMLGLINIFGKFGEYKANIYIQRETFTFLDILNK